MIFKNIFFNNINMKKDLMNNKTNRHDFLKKSIEGGDFKTVDKYFDILDSIRYDNKYNKIYNADKNYYDKKMTEMIGGETWTNKLTKLNPFRNTENKKLNKRLTENTKEEAKRLTLNKEIKMTNSQILKLNSAEKEGKEYKDELKKLKNINVYNTSVNKEMLNKQIQKQKQIKNTLEKKRNILKSKRSELKVLSPNEYKSQYPEQQQLQPSSPYRQTTSQYEQPSSPYEQPASLYGQSYRQPSYEQSYRQPSYEQPYGQKYQR